MRAEVPPAVGQQQVKLLRRYAFGKKFLVDEICREHLSNDKIISFQLSVISYSEKATIKILIILPVNFSFLRRVDLGDVHAFVKEKDIHIVE